MRLTIERSALLKALNHVQSVVERRNTIPILANALLRAEDGVLSMTATDMDLEVVESVPAEIQAPGATTAPAVTLHDIVRKLPDGSQVELDSDGSVLTLRAGRSRFQLGCLPVEDFPAMSGGELPSQFSLAAKDLRLLIDRTRFAISTEETRYYLNGIFFHGARSGSTAVLRAVATDGHRLARVEIAQPEGAAGMPDIILPRKTVGELRKLLDEASDGIEVRLSETKARFSIGPIVLTSKLIDGTFPDYERVIPSGNDRMLVVDAKALTKAVDRVSTIATEKSRAVKFTLSDGSLIVSATNAEQGNATEEIEVGYRAERMEIGFNARYLLDITQQIEGDGAHFALADSGSPTIVRDAADTSALYVLMPMRV